MQLLEHSQPVGKENRREEEKFNLWWGVRMEYEKKQKNKWGNGEKVEVRKRRRSFMCDQQKFQPRLQCSSVPVDPET